MKKLLFAFAALMLSAILNAQSLDEIVNRFTKANMYDKITQLSTIKVKAKMSMPAMGVELPMELWMKNPDKMKTVTSFNGQEIISSFDGKKGYTINPMTGSTTPVEMSEEEVKQAQGNNMFRNTLEENLKAGRLTLMGEESVNDRQAYKIKADIEGAQSILFIDKESYLLTKSSVTANQGGMTMTVDSYPSDYKEINGIILPMKTTTSIQGMDAEIIYEDVEVNIPMDDSIFTLK